MNFKKIAVCALAATAVALAAPAAAQAAPVEHWELCDKSCANRAEGKITWHNRTATLSGDVYDVGPNWTQIKATAYAGNTQVGKVETRTADDLKPGGSPLPFSFTVGDTNRPGGIDLVIVELCFRSGCVDETALLRP